jgi:hypothetical protein
LGRVRHFFLTGSRRYCKAFWGWCNILVLLRTNFYIVLSTGTNPI